MKGILHRIAAALSAAMAACCLLTAPRCRAARAPAPSAVQAGALQNAGQALAVLRRRATVAVRRAARALLMLLAAPQTALGLPVGGELWVDLQPAPAGAPRQLRLPGQKRAARPGCAAAPNARCPPGQTPPTPAHCHIDLHPAACYNIH